MNNQYDKQSLLDDSHNSYLAGVGSLLMQRVATAPSQREIETAHNFAAYLRAAREQRGLSRAELARQIDKSEFDVYSLEQEMVLSNQIDYALLRRLATALNEDADLLALILERDIAGSATKQQADPTKAGQPFDSNIGRWIRRLRTVTSPSLLLPRPSMVMATMMAMVVLCLLLLSPTSERLLTNSAESTPSVSLQSRSGEQLDFSPDYTTERRKRLQIVYTNPNKSSPENSAYFAVDPQRVAMVSYLGKPLRRNLLE